MVVLVGFMGAGKTVVGRDLARRRGVPFVDLDETIERSSRSSIGEMFAARGEAAFRALEAAALERALAGPRAVLAAGGGIVEDAANRELLGGTTVVFLDVSLADALARIGKDPGRPMLARVDPGELLAARRPLYEQVADIVVDTSGRTVDEVVDEVAARIDAWEGA